MLTVLSALYKLIAIQETQDDSPVLEFYTMPSPTPVGRDEQRAVSDLSEKPALIGEVAP